MAAHRNKPWRRESKRVQDQTNVGPCPRLVSSFGAVNLRLSCHRFRSAALACAIAVWVFASRASEIHGLRSGTAPHQRQHRPWKQCTRQECPCYPAIGQPRPQQTSSLSLSFHTVLLDAAEDRDDAANEKGVDAEEPGETWTVGNVEEDLRQLEKAIALSMADQRLQQQERLDMLDYFAHQRRPVREDVRTNVVAPLLASLLLMSLARALPAQRGALLLNFVGAACDIHFWTVYVAAPAAFLAILSFRNRAKAVQDLHTPPPPFRGINSSGMRRRSLPSEPQLSVFGEEASTDPAVADPVVCLIEQWCSATLGMLVTVPFVLRQWIDQRIVLGLILMTKVAAFFSLHQFPLLYYRALRSNQSRPIALPVWAVTCLARLRLHPWCVVPDLVRLGLSWSWHQAALAHVVAGAAVLGITYGAPRRLSGNHPRPLLPRPRLLGTILTAAWTARHSHSLRMAVSRLVRAAVESDRRALVAGRVAAWDAARTLLLPCAVVLASVGPCAHLVAFRRLVRVSHCDRLSLAGLQDNGSCRPKHPAAQDERTVWRWRLHWREPRRVLDVVKQWRDDFFYWLFLSGSVQEQLRRELDSKRQQSRQGPAHQRGLAVLQRMARDQAAEREYGLPPPDRTKWKQTAMDRLARVHKKNYERNTMEDPLGIALYKSLGIGLGFNFDYMSRLPPRAKPSIRRLQARAAKSAIRRVQEIYDPEVARRELDAIKDPMERDRRAKDLQEQARIEIEGMAAKLSNLIPLDMAHDIPSGDRVEDFSLNDLSNSPSSLLRRLLRSNTSTALERLVDRYGRSSNAPDSGDDSEFVEAWERQRYGRFSAGDGNSTLVTALA